MDDENEFRSMADELPGQAAEEAPVPKRPPYVRSRPAHKTMDPIDDLVSDGVYEGRPTHDSDVTARGGVFTGGAYRRGRSEMNQLRRDLHYGQYLEIPKGRRDIFASRERTRRIKSFVALVVVLALLAVVALIVWQYMQTNWGATG